MITIDVFKELYLRITFKIPKNSYLARVLFLIILKECKLKHTALI